MNQVTMKAILASLIVICSGVSSLRITNYDAYSLWNIDQGKNHDKYFIVASELKGCTNVSPRHCFVEEEHAVIMKENETHKYQFQFILIVSPNPQDNWVVDSTYIGSSKLTAHGTKAGQNQKLVKICTIKKTDDGKYQILYPDVTQYVEARLII